MSINKVAKLAGVSSSTVSRVINNHPRVAPETAQNVRKAMQELNYTPSDRRPGPKPSFRSRTGVANIAFLVLGTSRSRATPAFEFLLRGVSTGASRNDLNLIFNHLSDPDHIPPRILDQRIDGLLLHGAVPGGELRDRLQRMPTVWLMGNRRRPDWGDQVLPDGFEIGPGKTELISCNNEEPYLVGLIPKPAVIDIRVESIGARGVDQLLWRLEHPDIHERIITAIEPFVVTNEPSPLSR